VGFRQRRPFTPPRPVRSRFFMSPCGSISVRRVAPPSNARSSLTATLGWRALRVAVFSMSCVAVLASSPFASAAAGSGAPPHRFTSSTFEEKAEFSLPASNGYRLKVSGEVDEHGSSDVTFEATRGNTSASYFARGSVTERGMHASLGALGMVSLRFHLAKKHPIGKNSRRCFGYGGPAAETRLGALVGTVRFRGEQGYTEVLAHRVHGGIHETVTCSNDEFGSGKPQSPNAVLLNAESPSKGLVFEATTYPGEWIQSGNTRLSGPDLFVLVAGEKREGVEILRLVIATATKSDFTYDSTLTSATVTPPPPFTGSATFSRATDGSTSWTGSLSAPVPGLGLVALVEPRLKGELETRSKFFESLE
jgi:hypothetical protein